MKGLLFTFGLTYGGSVVALFNPFYGLLIYICFSIIRPEVMWSYSVPRGNYSRTIAIALLFGWILNGLGNWNFGRGKHLVYLLLGFYAWFIFSAFNSPFQDIVWKQVEEMFKIVLPCIVCATLLDSREKLHQMAWVITLSAGYAAWRQNEMYLFGLIENGDNQIAHTFAIGAGVGLFLGFIEQRTVPRLVAFACSGLMFHGVLIHMSRGAMVGLAAIGVVGVCLIPKTKAVIRWLFLASVAGLIMAGPSVRDEFATVFAPEGERDASAESRFELWSAMWDCALRNPVTGVGLQGWPKMASQYGFTPGKQGHGLWPQALAETGFPGAVLYFSYFAVCILSLLKYVWLPQSETDPEYRLFAIMVIASLSGWIVEEMFGSFYGIELPYYIAAMGIGILRLTTVREPVWKDEYYYKSREPSLATQRGMTGI